MSKHTPGPWEFLEDGYTETEHNRGRPLTIFGGDNNDLASVYSADDSTASTGRDEAIANARLIAAAPDLLEMVKLFERSIQYEIGRDSDGEGRRMKTVTLGIVSDAIAKAEGRIVP